jgi:hypothetical protein
VPITLGCQTTDARLDFGLDFVAWLELLCSASSRSARLNFRQEFERPAYVKG